MKIAKVKKIEFNSAYPSLEEISVRMDDQKERLFIDTINWKGYMYKPEVELSIAYSDMLSVPHYVTWNAVGTEKPDYHQPAYFGLLKFV